MQIIHARNVEEALLVGLRAVNVNGVIRDSRVGNVRVFSTPVTTLYEKPKERVLRLPERDANPFFHFMEGLWMLDGRNDVEWISRFNSSIANYSDNGVTFHGAYGHRWRDHFGFDQLEVAAAALLKNPDDRRVCLQMWDAEADLGKDGKDFPCNQMINFRVFNGKLDMTVFNRSNDMIWGAYGANAVHFSMMQEVLAAWAQVDVGSYWQVSTNFHAYLSTIEKHQALLHVPLNTNAYASGVFEPFPMVNTPINEWFQDLEMFMTEGPVMGFRDKFFKKVAVPMLMAWNSFKEKDYAGAQKALESCVAKDWRIAASEWIARRTK